MKGFREAYRATKEAPTKISKVPVECIVCTLREKLTPARCIRFIETWLVKEVIPHKRKTQSTYFVKKQTRTVGCYVHYTREH